MSQNEEAHEEGGGPPWIQPAIQQHINWRDGDILISVPAKSGTTWTMNIVYQLLNGGTPDFEDVYAEVPWIEFVTRPGQPMEELLAQLDAMPADKPRAFKTHSAPPDLPFFNAEADKKLKYLVVARNPEEALVSFRPFLGKHNDAWFDLWGMPKAGMYRDDFPGFYNEVIAPAGMQGMFFGFMAAWWQLRHEPNVMFIHFSDMKRDHEGSVRKIADFLGITPTDEQWLRILEYTSFEWMKAHEEKFEAHTVPEVPILNRGAMIRKGEAGQAKADGMTDEIAAHLRAVGNEICPFPDAIDWYYNGGPLP